jgi:hypothetical protein
MTLRDRIHEEAQELRAMRDELRVQMHLSKLEARDLWDQLEGNWEHAESKLGKIGEASQETAEDVGQAAKLLLDELKEGYRRLRKLL